jgi:hypothetical protein
MSETQLGKLGVAPVVMPIGPVAYWWDTDEYQHWDLPEHWHYVEWRQQLNDALVEHGYLVFRHWEAFKGTWNNKMQDVNTIMIDRADVVINMKPDDVWSEGVDEEMAHLEYYGNLHKVIWAPPPKTKEEFSWRIKEVLEELDAKLGV